MAYVRPAGNFSLAQAAEASRVAAGDASKRARSSSSGIAEAAAMWGWVGAPCLGARVGLAVFLEWSGAVWECGLAGWGRIYKGRSGLD